MQTIRHNRYSFFPTMCISACLSLAVLLIGCASTNIVQSFDFGYLGARTTNPSSTQVGKLEGRTLAVLEIRVPSYLDSNAMLYRMNYLNQQELKPYANNRWSTTPAELLAQSLKQAINEEAGKVINAADGVAQVPQLRVELEEFAQHFQLSTQSKAVIKLRASLVYQNRLLAQETFVKEYNAVSPDAKGGAAAMATASSQLSAQVVNWLSKIALTK